MPKKQIGRKRAASTSIRSRGRRLQNRLQQEQENVPRDGHHPVNLSCTPRRSQRLQNRLQQEYQPEPTFNFLALPGEIRNMIYDFVFTSEQKLVFAFTFNSNRVHTCRVIPFRNCLAIRRVCRQINHETEAFWESRVLVKFELFMVAMHSQQATWHSAHPVSSVCPCRRYGNNDPPQVMLTLDDDPTSRMTQAIKLLPNVDKADSRSIYEDLSGLAILPSGYCTMGKETIIVGQEAQVIKLLPGRRILQPRHIRSSRRFD